jgi:hypothetical protein
MIDEQTREKKLLAMERARYSRSRGQGYDNQGCDDLR